MKEIELKVDSNDNLIDYLNRRVGYSKSKIKSLLKYDNIRVNDAIIKKDIDLKINDYIKVTNDIKVKASFKIVYEDDDFLVINKRAGLLTVSNFDKDHSLYNDALRYIKTKNRKGELYILHRIDKETSGIVVFTKNRKLNDTLQNDWNNLVKNRIYLGIVDGILDKKTGTLDFYLKDNPNSIVTVSNENDKDAKRSILDYKVLKENNNYSLLEIHLKTGRKNQIRVSFSHIYHPISGDKKYYSKTNIMKRLALVNKKIEIFNSLKNKLMVFEIDDVKDFYRFF